MSMLMRSCRTASSATSERVWQDVVVTGVAMGLLGQKFEDLKA